MSDRSTRALSRLCPTVSPPELRVYCQLPQLRNGAPSRPFSRGRKIRFHSVSPALHSATCHSPHATRHSRYQSHTATTLRHITCQAEVDTSFVGPFRTSLVKLLPSAQCFPLLQGTLHMCNVKILRGRGYDEKVIKEHEDPPRSEQCIGAEML